MCSVPWSNYIKIIRNIPPLNENLSFSSIFIFYFRKFQIYTKAAKIVEWFPMYIP